MNKQQDKLFEMINSTGYDMEDLIETISDPEVKRLIEVWDEAIREETCDLNDNIKVKHL